MLRKIAAMGVLALCSLASGCWFNSPCCSPYDKCGPTFGGDPSVPCDFKYRKGSILGGDTSAGGEYIQDGAEYVPDDGMATDQVEEQPQPVAQQPRRFPGLVRTASPMNQGARYPGMAYRGGGYQRGGYQSNAYQGGEPSRDGYQDGGYEDGGNQDANYQDTVPNRGGSYPMNPARRYGRMSYQNDSE